MFLSTKQVREMATAAGFSSAVWTDKTSSSDAQRRSVVWVGRDAADTGRLCDFFQQEFARLGVENTVKITGTEYVRVIAHMA
jgi:hypothetical protein